MILRGVPDNFEKFDLNANHFEAGLKKQYAYYGVFYFCWTQVQLH